MAEQVNRREQVAGLIKEGVYTKAEIAEKLEVKPSGVSSQMTYLRWMGNFIITDPDTKVLSFCTEEEFNEAEAEKAVKRGSKTTAPKDPQEAANALAKTIARQEAQYTKAEAKLAQVNADLDDEPGDEELQELQEEANANAVLLRIKIKRNKARAMELPEPVESDDDDVEEAVEAEVEDDLL